MARRPAFERALAGRWRIVEMDTWPDDVLDGDAHIMFSGVSDGEIAFVVLKGFLDVRYGAREGNATAEFTFDGFDEGYPVSGRGWASLGTAGRLVGTSTSTKARIKASSASPCDFFNGLRGAARHCRIPVREAIGPPDGSNLTASVNVRL